MTAPAAIQKTLRLPGLPELPTMTVEAARTALTYDEDEVVRDAEDRLIEWCWNIASAGARRRELRLFRPSVLMRRAVLDNPKTRVRGHDLGTVKLALFPQRGRQPWVTTPQFAAAFVCSDTQVIDLVREGALALLPGVEIKRGAANASLITWGSVEAFLNSRRI